MLTRVQITNFKSIGEGPDGGPGVDIALKPLTFLVGPNGGGKSSILEAILLLIAHGQNRNMWQQDAFPGSLVVSSRNETPFVDWPALIHDGNSTRALSIAVPLHISAGTPFGFLLGLSLVSGRSDSPPFPPEEREYCEDVGWPDDDHRVWLRPSWTRTPPGRSSESRSIIWRIVGDAVYANTYIIVASRGQPRRFTQESEGRLPPRDVGVYGQNLELYLLSQDRLPEDDERRYEDILARLGKGRPKIRRSRDGIEDTFEDVRLGTRHSGNAASQGSRQAHIVIAQVMYAKPGSVIMIEEPEISLHPEAQVHMCRFLAEHAARGKQIIATTHSPFMLLALQYPVEEGLIKPDQIAVYEVEREKKTGATKATPLKIGKDGVPKGGVPSFTRVEQRLLRKWMESLPRARVS